MRQSFRRLLPVLLVLMLAGGIVLSLNAQSALPLPRIFVQETKLTASDGATGDYFGTYVAIDGDTAVIGSPRDDNTGNESGAAYVFVRDGDGNWTQQQKLTPSDPGATDNFGLSVAISGDTVIVGAPAKATNTGAAYVFVRDGDGNWTQQQKLTTSDAGQLDLIGAAVKVIGDTAFVGAPGEGLNGAVYVFTRNAGVWTHAPKLTASDGALLDLFGASIHVKGNSAIFGAPGKSNKKGAAYVFTYNGSTWTQQQKLTAINAANDDYFGWSVAIDGTSVLVGAPMNDSSGSSNGSGKAYAFTYNGSTWLEQQVITQLDPTVDERFGWQLILNGDQAIISDDGDDANHIDGGAVYIFERVEGFWVQQDKLVTNESAGDAEFGGSIALSGTTLLAGAPGRLGDTGAAYIYEDDPNEPTVTPTPTSSVTPGSTEPTPTFTSTPPLVITEATATFTGTGTVESTPTATETEVAGLALLVNGGFELDNDTDKNPDGWTSKNNSKDKQKCNKPEKVIAYEGDCAYQFKSGAAENSKLVQHVDLSLIAPAEANAGDTITLSGFVQLKGAVNVKVKVRVTYADTSLGKGKITVKLNAPTSGYQPFTGDLALVLADDASSIKIVLQNKGTSGKVRMDAIALQLSNDAAPLIALP